MFVYFLTRNIEFPNWTPSAFISPMVCSDDETNHVFSIKEQTFPFVAKQLAALLPLAETSETELVLSLVSLVPHAHDH